MQHQKKKKEEGTGNEEAQIPVRQNFLTLYWKERAALQNRVVIKTTQWLISHTHRRRQCCYHQRIFYNKGESSERNVPAETRVWGWGGREGYLSTQ